MAETFHDKLKRLTDEFVSRVYDATDGFPKKELFGVTSQLRRSSLSVMLNYIEGYARQQKNTYRNFMEIAFGSLKEAGYLIHFSYRRGFLNEAQYKELSLLADEIGKMMWGFLKTF